MKHFDTKEKELNKFICCGNWMHSGEISMLCESDSAMPGNVCLADVFCACVVDKLTLPSCVACYMYMDQAWEAFPNQKKIIRMK